MLLVYLKDVGSGFDDKEKAEKITYGRLISLASTALAKVCLIIQISMSHEIRRG